MELEGKLLDIIIRTDQEDFFFLQTLLNPVVLSPSRFTLFTLRFDLQSATSVLRNIQYEIAMLNFHSRAFGGFNRQSTLPLWRTLAVNVRKTFAKLRFPKTSPDGVL